LSTSSAECPFRARYSMTVLLMTVVRHPQRASPQGIERPATPAPENCFERWERNTIMLVETRLPRCGLGSDLCHDFHCRCIVLGPIQSWHLESEVRSTPRRRLCLRMLERGRIFVRNHSDRFRRPVKCFRYLRLDASVVANSLEICSQFARSDLRTHLISNSNSNLDSGSSIY
jgi:hypothetical protein